MTEECDGSLENGYAKLKWNKNKVRARKEGATDDDVIELLGSNVDGPSYDNYECGDVGANTRCYAQVGLTL